MGEGANKHRNSISLISYHTALAFLYYYYYHHHQHHYHHHYASVVLAATTLIQFDPVSNADIIVGLYCLRH